MPPRLSEYRAADWRRLRPLLHRIKALRLRAVDALYMRRPAPAGDQSELLRRLKASKLLVTVAFNDPQAIAWQAKLVRYYVPNALYVVADNSTDEVAATATAACAAAERVLYFRLPANPWQSAVGRYISRSHGTALNWIWRNVIRPGEPEMFGFIDDDLFPTALDDPFAPLATQDFYGVLRSGKPVAKVGQVLNPGAWFLWPGFCFFRFDKVRTKPLDFGQDWSYRLDTGGGNWDVLYRHVDCSRMIFQPYENKTDANEMRVDWCGSWVHEVGTANDSDVVVNRRRLITDTLKPFLTLAERAVF
jgi:hypothetical protein